jgi:DNA primase
LGIDSAGYSLPYVASWSGGDLTKVSATANRVIGCARMVLTELEHERRLERDPTSIGPRVQVSDREPLRRSPASAARSDLEGVVAAAAAFYAGQLRAPEGAEAAEYLRERGITAEAIDRWELGFAPDSWEALTTALRKEGIGDDLLLDAGVSGRSRYGRLYDRMRNRIIFPIHDEHGTPVGFAGRLLAGDGPKYLNTPETELYQKRSLLYGLHLARQPIIDQKAAVVVEGYTDAIAAHQAGITNVVATAGTALTEEHLARLATVTDGVTLAFDGDDGGQLATLKLAETSVDKSLQLRVAQLPGGRDPADLLRENDIVFEQALSNARPFSHHLITVALRTHNLDEPEGIARAVQQSGRLIASIPNRDERDGAVRLVAALLGRPESTVRRYMQEPLLSEQRRQKRARGAIGVGR